MADIVKFVPDSEVMENGLVPLFSVVLVVLVIIFLTIIFVKNEIKGVKKNEKN